VNSLNLSLFIRDKTLFLYALCLVFASAAAASMTPYQSIIAIEVLGFKSEFYSILLITIAAVTVLFSIIVGSISDYLRNRSLVIIVSSTSGVFGHLIMTLFFSKISFIVAHVILIPLAFTLFQQFFAIIRVHCSNMPSSDADAITSSSRTLLASSYVIIPPIIGFFVAKNVPFANTYAVGAFLYTICLLIASLNFCKKEDLDIIRVNNPKNKRFFFHDYKHILVPILMVCLLEASRKLHGIIFPLIVVSEAGGTKADVGFLAGIIAIMEIPFMLMWSSLLHRYTKAVILGFSGLIYAMYLFFLGHSNSIIVIYLLTPINVLGVSALMSINISYLQSLLPNQPGLSTSLISVTNSVGWGVAAFSFAARPQYIAYTSLAFVGCSFAMVGGFCILFWNRISKIPY
jgi:predicted MFS family arabinose efflux permease